MSILDNIDTKLSSNIKSNLKKKDGWDKICWGSPRHKKDSDHWAWEKFIDYTMESGNGFSNHGTCYLDFVYFPEEFNGYVNFEHLENENYRQIRGSIKNKLYVEINTFGDTYYSKLYDVNNVMDIDVIVATYIKMAKRKKITKNCML